MKFIILLIALLLGGGGGSIAFLGGGSSESATQTAQEAVSQTGQGQEQAGDQSSQSQASSLLGMLSGFSGGTQMASTSWKDGTSNTGKLDRTVASGAREKRTQIKGNGTDTVTIMVYLCGTDLESRSGMASNDIAEMCKANLSDKVNILLYTGGCKGWKTDGISNSTNQIYQVTKGGLKRLVDDDGEKKMTDPDTLSYFIKLCSENYPADRNELIFWDHGGGSLSGYGYDEKFATAGSMNLAGIDKALKNGGVTFDFIGFDACLMATLETALVMEPYADYLIASEETEPGIGWYYTNWLTKLSANTSVPTTELGKQIVDDFVDVCAQKCRGQKTTLSVIDVSELSQTVGADLSAFSDSTAAMISGSGYKTVSNARANTREFGVSSKIDQVDLVHLALNINTAESKALAQTLRHAVKYNRTSSNVTDAYGISAYFPYRNASKVNAAVSQLNALDMDDEYIACVRKFASLEVTGQAVQGGTASPFGSLFGSSSSSSSSSASSATDIIGALLGGGSGSSASGGLADFASMLGGFGFFDKSIDQKELTTLVAGNTLPSLEWEKEGRRQVLRLTEAEWGLVNNLLLNVFLDDGRGYIDLGLDSIFEFTEDGDLIGEYDGKWVAINSQPVAYYFTDSVAENGATVIHGRVPVLINGDRAELLVTFRNGGAEVSGVRYIYADGQTDTVAKAAELTDGDKIQPICDRYAYDGTYEDSYMLGGSFTYAGEGSLKVSDVTLNPADGTPIAAYMLTDRFAYEHWTEAIK
jgi:hypothetical protein